MARVSACRTLLEMRRVPSVRRWWRELALPVVTTSWPILLEAVRFATRTLVHHGLRSNWEEVAFHRRMNPLQRARSR